MLNINPFLDVKEDFTRAFEIVDATKQQIENLQNVYNASIRNLANIAKICNHKDEFAKTTISEAHYDSGAHQQYYSCSLCKQEGTWREMIASFT
jgi:hypothetical protein